VNKKKYNSILTIIVFFLLFLVNKIIALFSILFYVVFKNIPNILFVLGNRKYSNHKTDEAFLWFERACKFNNCSPRIKRFYAYELLKQGKVEKAENLLSLLIESNVREEEKQEAKIILSLIIWKKNNLDKAVSLLENVYENYKNTVVYQNLGCFYILQGEYDKALQFNLEAYDYNDSDMSIIDNLAQTYYYKGDYDKALEFYEKLSHMTPSFVTYYYYYSLVLLKKNNYKEALEAMKKGLNCKFSFLSIINKEDIEKKIAEIETLVEKIQSI
jgi:tetratricopeptide (TPR) repeat protein